PIRRSVGGPVQAACRLAAGPHVRHDIPGSRARRARRRGGEVMNPLRNPALSVQPFRRLSFAWLFGNFGDSLLILTLPIWVKDLTGSDSAAGLVFLALGLAVFLAPLAGYVADRVSRTRLLIVANLVNAAVVMSLLLVGGTGQ